MPLTRGSALLQKTAERSFWNSFNDIADPFDNLVYVKDSTQKTDTYTWLGSAPMPQEWVASKQAKAVPEQSNTLENKAWEASVKVNKELIKYQQWDEIGTLLASLGMKARAHQTQLHTTDLLNNTAGACYDGNAFFDDTHTDAGAAYTTDNDNSLTSNITTPADPTDTDFATAVRGAIDALYGFKDDQGHPFIAPSDNPADWVVMVPPTYLSIARRVQTSDSLTGPVGNDLKGKFTTRVNQFSTSTTTFYVFYAGSNHKPLVRQESQGIQLDDTMEGDEHFHTGDVVYSATWWGVTDYGQYRTAVLHTFT